MLKCIYTVYTQNQNNSLLLTELLYDMHIAKYIHWQLLLIDMISDSFNNHNIHRRTVFSLWSAQLVQQSEGVWGMQ